MKRSVTHQSFHDLLYTMRVARRLPRKVIATAIGIDASYLAALERGSRKPPSEEKLTRILDLFDASIREREQLQRAAYLARLPSFEEGGTPTYLLDTVTILNAIPELSTGEIRMVKNFVAAIIAEHSTLEAQM